MKKRNILGLGLVAVAVLGLAACSPKDGGKDKAASADLPEARFEPDASTPSWEKIQSTQLN